MFRGRNAPKEELTIPKDFATPLDELTYLLNELEGLPDQSLEEFIAHVAPPKPEVKSKRTSLVDSLKKLRRLGSRDDDGPLEEEPTPMVVPETPEDEASPTFGTPNSASSKSGRRSSFFGQKTEEARFLPMAPERISHVVEIIRRVAELVVTGEQVAASAQQQKDKLDKLADREEAGGGLSEEEMKALEGRGKKTPETDQYIAIFEHFFERNGLAMITNMLTGAAFHLKEFEDRQDKIHQAMASAEEEKEGVEEQEDTVWDKLQRVNIDDHDSLLLPPISVATQAIQSVSILVQNVSRATSLFFILSNNHVNQLINFPLEQYHVAERKKLNQEANGMSPRRFGSPELAELTTHFVTFLKSLAMRMNTDTLQFFLTYPSNAAFEEASNIELESSPENPQDTALDDDAPLDEIQSNTKEVPPQAPRTVSVKTVVVEFPLYDRALEFCSAHQDSFVRVTAMNICLNTLRLATVSPSSDLEEPGEIQGAVGSSPDGVLHNSEPLPLRERLAIAQFCCIPSRVERLVSPIFTKLAQLWGMFEEQFREMDSPTSGDSSSDDAMARKTNDKVARAKEKARHQKAKGAFNDAAYNVQDELLLLDDLLRVGLTTLNEQTIEMMFATFVYPLLLQPLLLYFQRSPVPDEVLFADPLNNHSVGRSIQASDLTATKRSLVSAPAKSALFFLAGVFQFLSNPPLLRLLFTALLHPMSPDTTGETMIRAKADVACMGPNGDVMIRIDPIDESGKMKTLNDRSSYEFGTITGQKCVSGSTRRTSENDSTCIFVLAPALAEILEFKGDNGALVARTRHNPYRKAILKCLTLSSELSDLRPLSVLAVDSAVSLFDGKFLADVLFGLDMKKFEDNLPVDERSMEAHMAQFDDRGIGGGAAGGESRLLLGAPSGGRLGFDHMDEVLSSFRSCLMKAVPRGNGTWKLEYDMIAAHALLCTIRGNPKSLLAAAKGVDRRCRQAAAFLSDIPECVADIDSAYLKKLTKQPTSGHTKELAYGTVMDMMFRGANISSDAPYVLSEVVELKAAHRIDGKPGHAVSVSKRSSFSTLCGRCCASPPLDASQPGSTLQSAMGSARAWSKLDAFSTMLNVLQTTDAGTVNNSNLGGFAVKRDGSTVATNDPDTILAPLSESLIRAVLDTDEEKSISEAQPGKVVTLVGQTAFPCVCEVPPSSAPLFSEAGAKVVSQGITWQSLYVVLVGHNLVLAEPEPKSSGAGRVVTRCRLEDLVVEKDSPDARVDTLARRLIISHEGAGARPPGLFLFETAPKIQDEGAYTRHKKWRSSLDIWFEDTRAVKVAFSRVTKAIREANAYRGSRISNYLAQGEGSAYPMSIPL